MFEEWPRDNGGQECLSQQRDQDEISEFNDNNLVTAESLQLVKRGIKTPHSHLPDAINGKYRERCYRYLLSLCMAGNSTLPHKLVSGRKARAMG